MLRPDGCKDDANSSDPVNKEEGSDQGGAVATINPPRTGNQTTSSANTAKPAIYRGGMTETETDDDPEATGSKTKKRRTQSSNVSSSSAARLDDRSSVRNTESSGYLFGQRHSDADGAFRDDSTAQMHGSNTTYSGAGAAFDVAAAQSNFYNWYSSPVGGSTGDTTLLQQLERQRHLASIVGAGGEGDSHSGSTSMIAGSTGTQGYGSPPFGWRGSYGTRQQYQPPAPQMTQYLQQLQAMSQPHHPSVSHSYNLYGSTQFDFSHPYPQQSPFFGSGHDAYGSTLHGHAGYGYAGYPPSAVPPTSAVVPSLSLSQTLASGAPMATLASDGFPVSLPVILARPEDALKLSSHQVLLRHQIEAFKASDEDVSTHTRGRNKPIMMGQVGIRCRHCAHLPVSHRQKGSTYFPASLLGLYQAAQNMSTTHMQCGLCCQMPDFIKHQFAQLLSTKVASSGAGRPFWAESAKKLGLVDTEDGIRFFRDLYTGASSSNVAAARITASSKAMNKETSSGGDDDKKTGSA